MSGLWFVVYGLKMKNLNFMKNRKQLFYYYSL